MAFSGTNPFLPASSNSYTPTSTNRYPSVFANPSPPAFANPWGLESRDTSLVNIPGSKFPNDGASFPTSSYAPVSERKYLNGLPREKSSDETGRKPFRQTHLGRLPLELRQMIYPELLAAPPAFAGHSFATISSNVKASSTAPIRYVHIQASYRQVMYTCRQIYEEAYPIFFASKAYFFAKPQDADKFLNHSVFLSPILRLETITALCLSGFVETLPLYSRENLDDIFSNPVEARRIGTTRQQLEMQTYKKIWSPIIYGLRSVRIKSLKTVGLCFHVGQELMYLNLLYGLTDMRRGIVEFVDAKKWRMREQNPDGPWSIQYAVFENGDFNRGKYNERLEHDKRIIEREVTDINSRAPGLQEGDERFVEVSIQWPVTKSPSQGSLSSDQDDSASRKKWLQWH